MHKTIPKPSRQRLIEQCELQEDLRGAPKENFHGGEIQSMLEDLAAATTRTDKLVHGLRERLLIVLSPEEDRAKEPKSEDLSTPMGRAIQAIKHALDNTNCTLDDMLSRLRL